MRVIGGTFRSRPLRAPSGAATRPTSDRLRETLFNVVAPRIAGAAVMDLYAGTGAVGIEALSRGADHVLFVESAPPALRMLRANLRSLAIDRGADIVERPVLKVLQQWAGSAGRPRDLVFLDPPYESPQEYIAVLELLGGAQVTSVLADGGLVIAEHATRRPLAAAYGRLVCTRTLRQGDASLSFFERRGTEADPAHG